MVGGVRPIELWSPGSERFHVATGSNRLNRDYTLLSGEQESETTKTEHSLQSR